MENFKTCIECGETKPLERDFHKDKSRADGYREKCKICRGCKPVDFGVRALPDYGLKKCTKCLEIKPLEAFNFRSLKTKKLVERCKSCIKLTSDAWYQRNKGTAKRKEANRKSGKKIRESRREVNRVLVATLKSVPCMDCGVRYDPWIMQFDHRDPTQKKYNIGAMPFNSHAQETILREAEKCDVVCANCHADRTHKRRVGTWQ